MTDDIFEHFVALADRWDLRELHRDVTGVLDGLDDKARPFVPSQLARALDMFLDSYDRNGPPSSAP